MHSERIMLKYQKIYNRLAKEPDIVVERKPGGYYAYLKSQR